MKYCQNCGAKLSAGAAFCENCGTKLEKPETVPEAARAAEKQPPETAVTEEKQPQEAAAEITVGGSGNIRLCPDGKYRWVYELPMMKNPVVLFTIWKVLGISALAPALLVFFISISDDGFFSALLTMAEVWGCVMAIFIVISLLAYTIVAASYGWKYVVLFIMNDDGVVHLQQEKQFKKAEAMAWLTAFAGAAAKNPTAAGAGLLAATKSSMTSEFKNVDSVIGKRRMNTIKVNQWFAKNQVYVDPADYDFVWEYITSRCKKAKIK